MYRLLDNISESFLDQNLQFLDFSASSAKELSAFSYFSKLAIL